MSRIAIAAAAAASPFGSASASVGLVSISMLVWSGELDGVVYDMAGAVEEWGWRRVESRNDCVRTERTSNTTPQIKPEHAMYA
jgi:hypothetical protein